MVMEVSDEHFSKARYPILVTLLGIVMEVNDEQPLNALYPILVTELSKVIVPTPFS